MSITIKIRNVYGSEMIYPVCEKAKLFTYLTGTKTLSRDAINCIKQLGYTVNVQPQTL